MDSFVADDGERLHCRVTGKGSSLILLHGWSASHAISNLCIFDQSQKLVADEFWTENI